ncbi:MAG TPA: hypothetical protein VKK31_08530 [Thermoanaerobaculia bacterium]|nr:hypothetical protein [Thermoanaerobaculia bacterium]
MFLLLLAMWIAAPLGATTLIRAGLDELAARSERVVLGEVIDAVSYWNQDKTFILTDVRIATAETIKGKAKGELTLTLLGGRVGDLTTLIVGGAELIPGRSYVLFLSPEKLAGAKQSLTVPDHCQGVFEVTLKGRELRAASQANRHPLVPDRSGRVEAPGGVEGFPLDTLLESLRNTVKRQEVQR